MRNKIYPFITAIVSLAVLCAILLTGTIVFNSEGVRSKSALERVYRKSFYDMCDSVNNLEVNLSKLMVSPQKSESIPLITTVASQATMAGSSLSSLPLSVEQIQKTGKYFNQVSDWCASYSRAITESKDTASFERQAEELYGAVRSINARLRQMSEEIDNGLIGGMEDGVLLPKGFNLDFKESEENSIKYPELIYDGPFSDAKKFEWTALEGKGEIDEKAALEIAKDFGVDKARVLGITEGKTAMYQLEGDDSYLSITKKGGYLVNYNRIKRVEAATLSDKQAQDKAVSYAASFGYDGLSPIWYNAQSGVGFVNLAPVVNGVTYYPDIIKVKVALDDGSLLGLEASGYCSSHRERELSPTIDEDTALSLISQKLAVKSISLALIPYGENDEKLCFEINGEYDNLDYFVYIDAYDGVTRDVLRVVDNEQGELIM